MTIHVYMVETYKKLALQVKRLTFPVGITKVYLLHELRLDHV